MLSADVLLPVYSEILLDKSLGFFYPIAPPPPQHVVIKSVLIVICHRIRHSSRDHGEKNSAQLSTSPCRLCLSICPCGALFLLVRTVISKLTRTRGEGIREGEGFQGKILERERLNKRSHRSPSPNNQYMVLCVCQLMEAGRGGGGYVQLLCRSVHCTID